MLQTATPSLCVIPHGAAHLTHPTLAEPALGQHEIHWLCHTDELIRGREWFAVLGDALTLSKSLVSTWMHSHKEGSILHLG